MPAVVGDNWTIVSAVPRCSFVVYRALLPPLRSLCVHRHRPDSSTGVGLTLCVHCGVGLTPCVCVCAARPLSVGFMLVCIRVRQEVV